MDKKQVNNINVFATADVLYDTSRVVPDLKSVMYILKFQESGDTNHLSRRVDSLDEVKNVLEKYASDECVSDIQGIVTGLVRLARELDASIEHKQGWVRVTGGMSKYFRTISSAEVQSIKTSTGLEFEVKNYSVDSGEKCW